MKRITILTAIIVLVVIITGCKKNYDANQSSNNNTTNWQNGLLPGLFSVSPQVIVRFSQGNLQYQASTNIWRFATNQWDYVGEKNSNISQTYSGWIDLFGWGTSGYNHGAICYQPWSISTNSNDYYAYGNGPNNLYDQTGQADWGYNAIYNGGNIENYGWRTLSINEWAYVFNRRNTVSGIRYAKANVNNVNGVILLPDNWNESLYYLNSTNTEIASYSINIVTGDNWMNLFEPNGAVFLPSSGFRIEKNVIQNDIQMGDVGMYWSSSSEPGDTLCTPAICFLDNFLFVVGYEPLRSNGLSVRLVKNIY